METFIKPRVLQNVASDLGLHFLPLTHQKDDRLILVKTSYFFFIVVQLRHFSYVYIFIFRKCDMF